METVSDIDHSRTHHFARPVWPLPAFNGREPGVIKRGARFPGVDLAYPRDHEHDLVGNYPNGRNGTITHFMPDSMPALAVADGVIVYAGRQMYACSVVVDHRNGWATYYANLEHMLATPTGHGRARIEHVKAGDVLGYVGSALPGEMKCLHFELWQRNDESHFEPVESVADMRAWKVLPWTDDRLSSTTTTERAA